MANKILYLIHIFDIISFVDLNLNHIIIKKDYFNFYQFHNLPETVEHFGFPFVGMEQLQLFDATDDGDMVANITLMSF